ncbi:uncharacterized protein EI97DRAFT_430564 [Westerdykella ornata]|uniref:Uncharacterized protein n=1 Tax=Westerdykella ornata TaxID=318751 RepID=A0A6A6JSY1_WESOR|nr:uncharacterized protein EI97DRAFT_430564 [Westerdykella ornata]KAF2279497.1 hypothetical protein EI97DRAFT_430564 [Westerdykella ornata]
MPSLRSTMRYLFCLAPALTVAAPAGIDARQEPAPPAPPAGGLTDVDIQSTSALTAEHLEAAFYKNGFAKFPASDFLALGLTEADVQSLVKVGETEATHVTTLLSAIAGAGAVPVEPCQYNFDAAFASAQTMVATARILEAVGVSAYLGAAPLIQSGDVLSAAASIVTVEARHQALIRLLSGAEAVPSAFDTALGPRAVFTLAAQFIRSCPEGSNLNIQAFPSISLQNPELAQVGQNLQLADAGQPSGGQFCAFVVSGATQFSPLTNGNCLIPQNLSGETYMMITKSQSTADAEVLAGPSVIQPS